MFTTLMALVTAYLLITNLIVIFNKGIKSEIQGKKVFLKYGTKQDHQSVKSLGIQGKFSAWFLLKSEGILERLGKKFGLITAPKSGDVAFDQLFHIGCNQPKILNLIANDSVFRANAIELAKMKVCHIECRGSFLVAKTNSTIDPVAVTEKLSAIATKIESTLAGESRRGIDYDLFKSFLPESIGLVTFTYGLFSTIELLGFHETSFIDPGQAWSVVSLVAGALFLSSGALMRTLLGPSSAHHRQILHWLYATFLFWPTFCFKTLESLNQSYDSAPALQSVSLDVVSKEVRQVGRHEDHFLIFKRPSSNESHPWPNNLRVSKEAYDATEEGMKYRMAIRQGYFNLNWLELIGLGKK
jgi:hypothetical protein